jgi:tetratricopeptide (TPR) repeat protein
MFDRQVRMVFTAALLAVLAATAPARAAGGGDGGGATGRPDDPDYVAGVRAIKASDFPEAIRLLKGVVGREPGNADAYNWLAYATRRNGDPVASIPIYEKALSLDPKHRGAHEYIGEAYLTLDNLAKAKEHLARLDKLCFLPCSEYRDLRKAVQAYEQSGGKAKPAAGKW